MSSVARYTKLPKIKYMRCDVHFALLQQTALVMTGEDDPMLGHKQRSAAAWASCENHYHVGSPFADNCMKTVLASAICDREPVCSLHSNRRASARTLKASTRV